MQKVLSGLRKTVSKYNLIRNGDKIAVGLSGGKDSLVLLKALKMFQKFGLYQYELVAVLVDMYSGKEDYSILEKFCEDLGVKLTIAKTDIYEIVFNLRKEKNPCSLCAKMRRGILNQTAKQLGCNKIALGHHLQDVVETFFLSMLYEGRLSTMKPKSYMSNSEITLIRPMFLVNEETIANASRDLPVKKSKCPADKNSKRQEVEKLINDINNIIPKSKDRIKNAIISSEEYNLLDEEY